MKSVRRTNRRPEQYSGSDGLMMTVVIFILLWLLSAYIACRGRLQHRIILFCSFHFWLWCVMHWRLSVDTRPFLTNSSSFIIYTSHHAHMCESLVSRIEILSSRFVQRHRPPTHHSCRQRNLSMRNVFALFFGYHYRLQTTRRNIRNVNKWGKIHIVELDVLMKLL